MDGFPVPGFPVPPRRNALRPVRREVRAKGAMIGRIECDHLAFRNEDADWQLWIESGGKPIPRKLVITNRVSAGAPQYTLQFRDWKTDAAIAPDSFAFTAPSGAKKLEMQEFAKLSDLDEVPASIVNGAK